MRYDLVVIGGGSAGLTAVSFAAKLGARVALVEKERLGGDCTWTGCVPSKALLHVAQLMHQARQSQAFRTDTASALTVNMKAVRRYLQGVIEDIYRHETPRQVEAQGVEVLFGAARFIDSHTVSVNGKLVKAKNFLIATGARPSLPSIDGLSGVPFHTYETIFDNEQLPDHLLILGAGSTGLELGQAYGRLGARVTVIDGAPPLEAMGEKASATIKAVLVGEGVEFVRAFAQVVRRRDKQTVVETAEQQIQGDLLLVATGRTPNVMELDLQKAGVRFDQGGIKVNEKLQSSVSHIYAAGDCTGGPQFTHYAGWQAFQATRNALLPGSDKGVRQSVISTVFTDPEVAQVGFTLEKARERYGEDAIVTSLPLNRVDRAVTARAEAGFIDVLHMANGRLLGAVIVAPRAGELINEFALALQHELNVRDVASAIHAYPSYGMGIQRMAANLATDQFLNTTTGKIIKKIAGY